MEVDEVNNEEQADRDKMNAEANRIKLGAFDTARFYIKNGVANTGFKSVGDAVIASMTKAHNSLDELLRAYLKRWPD